MKKNIQVILLGFLGAMLYQFVQSFLLNPSWAKPRPETITASRIDLVDKQGRTRIILGFAQEGPPGIWINDEKGVPRFIAGLYHDQTSYLGLQDKNGQMIELMRSVGSDETPLLIFKNKGADKMITGLNTKAEPFLMFYDKSMAKDLFGKYAP